MSDIFDALQDKIRERMNEIADIVSTGGCQDWSAYKHLTGTIHGLAEAERMLLDLKIAAAKAED